VLFAIDNTNLEYYL